MLAKTLEEALEVLEKYGDRTQVIAGGTMMVPGLMTDIIGVGLLAVVSGSGRVDACI